MQLYGQSSPWNVGMAYRAPDTNFNFQGSYQQGRAYVQLSWFPDEYAPIWIMVLNRVMTICFFSRPESSKKNESFKMNVFRLYVVE